MFRRFGVTFAICSMVLDAIAVVAALALAEYWRPGMGWLPFSKSITEQELVPIFLFVVAPLIWVLVLFAFSMYDGRAVFSRAGEIKTLILGTAFAGLITAGSLYLTYRFISRWLFVIFIVLVFVLAFAWRVIARIVSARRGQAPGRLRQALVIGAGEIGQTVGRQLVNHYWAGLRLVGYLDDRSPQEVPGVPVIGKVSDARQVAIDHHVDEVIMTLPDSEGELENLFKALLDLPLHVRVVPASLTLVLDHPVIDNFAGIPMIDLRAGPLSEEQRMAKRAFDLILGGLATLLALPVMAVVALAVKMSSPGPVLFRQPRVGENGRIFTMLKFRSMVEGAENMSDRLIEYDGDGNPIHKHKDDPRVTRVGRFIRRTSLDELPQFFNMLKGEMSLVGPRPELPWLVERYQPWQRRRLVVPPGITGWWQVHGRSDRLMHLHTDDDIYYIANYSFWLDIRILWKTFWIVLAGSGAH